MYYIAAAHMENAESNNTSLEERELTPQEMEPLLIREKLSASSVVE